MAEKSCFFIGVPKVSESVYPRLVTSVERHITQHGVTAFFVHQLTEFDSMASKAVRNIKCRYPEVTLTLVQSEPLDGSIALALFDGVFYPPKAEDEVDLIRMIRGDFFIMEYCDYLITCVEKETQQLLTRFADTRPGKNRLYVEHLEYIK